MNREDFLALAKKNYNPDAHGKTDLRGCSDCKKQMLEKMKQAAKPAEES